MNCVIGSPFLPSPNPSLVPDLQQTTQIARIKLAKKFCEWSVNQEYAVFYSNVLNEYSNNNFLSALNTMIISNNIRSFVTLPQANPADAKRNIILFVNNLDFSDLNLNTFCNIILQM